MTRVTPVISNTQSPPSTHAHSARCATLSVGLLVSVSALALLCGCEPKEDAAANAIKNATIRLANLAPDAVRPGMSAQDQVSEFTQVAQSMQQVAATGTSTQKSAANVLIARAYLAAAEPHAQRAAELERTLLDLASEVRGHASTWEQQSSRAQTLAGYNPTKELSEIAAEVNDVNARQAEREERLSELKLQLGQLNGQIELATDRAKQERLTEAQLTGQANRTSGQPALDLVYQATDHRRQADTLEQQAGGLSAKAAALAPQITQIEVEIESLQTLRDQLSLSRDAVQQRALTSREQAAEARELANAAQTRINTLVAEIEVLRTGELREANDAAIEALESGERAATAATSDQGLRTEATMIQGRINHAMGSLHLARESSLEPLGSLMSKLNAARPELDNITEFSRYAIDINQHRTVSAERALDSLRAAHEAFGSVSGGQHFQDTTDKLLQKMSGFATDYSDGKVSFSSGETEFDEPTDTTEYTPDPPSTSADQTTPQGAMDMLFNAAREKDFLAIGRLVHTNDPAMRDMIDTVTNAASAGFGLSDALTSAFGVNLIDALKQASESPEGQQNQLLQMAAGGLAMMDSGAMGADQNPAEDFQRMLSMTSADLEFDTSGNTSTVSDPTDPSNDPLTLVDIDGQWFLDFTSMMASGTENVEQIEQAQMMAQIAMPFVQQITDAITHTRSDVESGSFDSSDRAILSLIRELEPMLQGIQSMMGGMMGGMGGGGE